MHYALCIKKFARRTLKNPSDSFLHYEVRTANFRILRILLCAQRTLEFFTPITPLYTIPTKFAIYWIKFIRRSKNFIVCNALFHIWGKCNVENHDTRYSIARKKADIGEKFFENSNFQLFFSKIPKDDILDFSTFPTGFSTQKGDEFVVKWRILGRLWQFNRVKHRFYPHFVLPDASFPHFPHIFPRLKKNRVNGLDIAPQYVCFNRQLRSV